ncbi:12092_t:CDS:2 [Entrophospora sp. SA101]|nr:12092_t:CDS:2 [Entrophospora sp. SA101]
MDEEFELVAELNDWVKKVSTVSGKNIKIQSHNKFKQQDLFIGFDSNETIQSLIINIKRKYPDDDNEEILEKCKECLVAIATSDGMVRSENSLLKHEEILKWKEYYFKIQHHDSLFDYFNALLKQNDPYMPEAEGKQVIVNTFSNINTDIEACLSNKISCQVDKLSTFKSETQFQNRIKHFWQESDKQIFILQCDITTVNVGCIKLAKFIIEQLRGEFLIKRHNSNNKIPMKHMHSKINLYPAFLEKSMADIINTIYPFEDILKQELLWVLITQIPNNKNLVTYLKDRTQKWLETNPEPDWQNKVASDKKLLYPYSSFSGALQAYLRIIIRKPIAKLLCAIERLSATSTLFLIDGMQSQNLLEFWIKCFMDQKIVNIDEISDPKPDGYSISVNNYNLELPFSFCFVKRIESFKELFEEEINQYNDNEGNIDPKTGELYHHFFNGYIKGFSIIVKNSIPSFKQSLLNLYPHLYFNDFVKLISSDDPAGYENLASLLTKLIGEEQILDTVFLHAYLWRNAKTVLNEYQSKFPKVKITDCNNSESFEHSQVKEMVRVILYYISELQNLTHNIFEQWQHDVRKVLSLGMKVLKGQQLLSHQMLTDFINKVFDVLYQIEPIDKYSSINDAYKEKLTSEQENEIASVVWAKIPADALIVTLKRFMLRFLSAESKDYSKHLLSIYLKNEDLYFWPLGIDEAIIGLFPDTLLEEGDNRNGSIYTSSSPPSSLPISTPKTIFPTPILASSSSSLTEPLSSSLLTTTASSTTNSINSSSFVIKLEPEGNEIEKMNHTIKVI